MTDLQSKDLDILLIGKTGNGKSATGNTILRRKAFESKPAVTSVTTNVSSEVSTYNGRIVRVVDTPGIGDNRMDSDEAIKLVIDAMEEAIAINDDGYHAFILVIRFGGRFTQEDADTLKFLKRVFGDRFVKNYCILVLTCGDNFERECEEYAITFTQWCKDQGGVFCKLIEECAGRVILFDNKTRDEEKITAQLDALIKMVDQLGGKRYTDEHFDTAKEARKCITVEAVGPKVEKKMMEETSLILQELSEIKKKDLQERVEPLNGLSERCTALYNDVKTQDQGTSVLSRLYKQVSNMRRMIEDEYRLSQRLPEEIAKMKEEMQKEMNEKLDRKAKELEEAYKKLKKDYETETVKKVASSAGIGSSISRGFSNLVAWFRG